MRLPHLALRPFVRRLWISETPWAAGNGLPALEWSLPSGLTHVVFRLTPEPAIIADDKRGTNRRALAHAVVGGARTAAYVRHIGSPARAVGAQLEPGAASVLFGVPAGTLGEQHASLDDLWGPRAAAEARERLAEAGSPGECLDLLEALLRARLPPRPKLPAVVHEALACLGRGATVAETARATRVSHRYLTQVFRAEVGLPPKAYGRVLRFQRALVLLGAPSGGSLADVALQAGFSDQAHLTRELVALGGVTPAYYRALRPAEPNHVPIVTSSPVVSPAVRNRTGT